MRKLWILIHLTLLSLTCHVAAEKPATRPLNIGHRGSSGRLPEHTLEAYRLAIKEGADFIECDVYITKDLKLVCRHESWLNETTNIWQNQTLRSRVKTYNIPASGDIRNKTVTDIFTVDLTLEELKTIRVRQKYPFRDHSFDDMYQIPTLEEYIRVAKSADRKVGIYPELKSPEWINSLDIIRHANTTFEDLFVEVLHNNGYREKDALCFVQSFSEESIRSLSTKTRLPLVMLYEYRPANEQDKMKNLSSICSGIGVWKNIIIPVDQNNLQSTTDFVTNVHNNNLKVHAFTFRNENKYLAWNYSQDPYNEYQTFLNTQIDGYFTDFPGSFKRFLDMTYTEPASKPCVSGVPSAHSSGRFYKLILSIAAFLLCVMSFA